MNVTLANPISWVTGPVSSIWESIQSNPDAWFRWTGVILLALIVRRLGNILREMRNSRFRRSAMEGTPFGQYHQRYDTRRTGEHPLATANLRSRANLSDFGFGQKSNCVVVDNTTSSTKDHGRPGPYNGDFSRARTTSGDGMI